MDAVRSDPECAWITDSVECEGTDIRAEVQCQRSDSEEPLVLTYTLEDYEQERAVMGRKPLTTWQKKDPDLRQQLRHKAIQRFLEIHWPSATALSRVRVHDLKHTFGRRLRAAGVPVETRKVLLGHRNGDITTHRRCSTTAASRPRGAFTGVSLKRWNLTRWENEKVPRRFYDTTRCYDTAPKN